MKRIAVALLVVAPVAAASIRGRVVSGGDAVANAKISAFAMESQRETIARVVANRPRVALGTTTTAADGTFTLPIDGHGCIVVRVEAAMFAPSFTEAALDDHDVLIGLAPKQSFNVTLRSPAGPLAGARVVVFAQDSAVESRTDDGGKLALDRKFDDATMLVLHPLVAPQVVDLQPRDGIVDVDPGVTLRGSVIDARGKGVAGAAILIDSLLMATSSTDGSFAIERAPRHYSVLLAEAGDFGGELDQTAAKPVIRVTPRFSVSGIVRDTEGRPLRGIPLLLTSDDHEELALTDADGRFTIRVAPGRYDVSSASASYRLPNIEWRVQKSLVKNIVAERAPILAGIVRRTDGSPVAGAQVIVATHGTTEKSETPATFTTGPDGRFRLAAPLLGSPLLVVAYKRGLSPAESREVDPFTDARDLSIVLHEGVELSGTVRDPARHPLAGVAVTMLPNGSALADVFDPPLTDNDGRFCARVTEGTWQATFFKEGYLPGGIYDLELTAQSKPLTVTLEPEAIIRGHVVRSDGTGIEDAIVILADGHDETTTTAADGLFMMPVDAGAHLIGAVTRGGAIAEAKVIAPTADARIVIGETGVLSGRVVDKTGAPVTTFRVLVTPPSSDIVAMKQFTDADGRFTLGDVSLGDIDVTVSADGFFKSSKSGVEIETGKATGEITFTLLRGRTARGRVVSSTGQPLDQVDIGDARESNRWNETKDRYQVAKSDADGAYEASDLAIDHLPLKFEKEGFTPIVRDVPPGDDDVNIDVELRPTLVLTGRVIGPEGQPIPHAKVAATSSAATAMADDAETDEFGAFRLEHLSPARYDLSATTVNGGDQGGLSDVDVERINDVTLCTRPVLSGAVSGEITGVEPDADIAIHVRPPDGVERNRVLVKPGHYRLPNVPIGRVVIQATLFSSGENRWTQPVVVDVVPNGEVRADLHLPESFPITGRVLRDGVPLANEEIDFTEDSGQQAFASTGKDGTYSADLVAGRYRITAGSYFFERDIAGPGTIDIDVDLDRIAVTVVDAATETPIEDARIIPGGYTNVDGQAKLDLPRGAREIVVEKEGYGTAVVAVPSSPSLLIRLTRSEEVAVHIVDARDGRPLAGKLTVRDTSGRIFYDSSFESINGTTYVALNPGRYRFTASATGYRSQTVTADVPPFDVRIPLSRVEREP